MTKVVKQKLSSTLAIYQRENYKNDFFYVAIKLPRDKNDKGARTKYERKCLYTTDIAEAKRLAHEEEGKLKFRTENNIPVGRKEFQKSYEEWIATGLKFKSESRRETHTRNGQLYFFEYFNQRELGLIDEVFIDDYWQWRSEINAKRDLEGTLHPNAKIEPSAATLYMEKDSLNQFFKWAVKRKLIQRKFIIEMPIQNQRNRRPAFSLEEYKELRRGIRQWAWGTDPLIQVQQFYQRQLIHYAVRFCIESGLRPKELFSLRWKDISYFDDEEGNRQMLIYVSPQTKTGERHCVPTFNAQAVLQEWFDGTDLPNGVHVDFAKYKGEDDYIFANYWGNYYKAHERATKKAFEYCGLLKDAHGKVRTFYSGRHCYATFRLLYGDNVDAFKLAKNMGTSVEMIEKHYSKVRNIQNAVVLTSTKKRKPRKEIFVDTIDADKVIPFPVKEAA